MSGVAIFIFRLELQET